MSRLYIAYRPTTPIPPFVYEPETIEFLTTLGVSNDSTLYMGLTIYAITGSDLWTLINNTVITFKNTLGLALGSETLKTRVPYWNPFLLDSTSTQKYSITNTSLYVGTFNGGVTTTGAGFQPNGTNGYLDTTVTQNGLSLAADNIGVHILSKTSGSGVYADIGSIDNTGGNQSDIQIYTEFSGNLITKFGTSGVADSTAITNSIGLSSIVRSSSTSYKAYKNGTLLTTYSRTMSGDKNNEKIFVGALDNDGSPAQYSPRLFTHALVTDGVSGAELATLATTLDGMDTALNRY